MEEANSFINITASIDTCAHLQDTPYQGVDHTSLRPPLDVKNCLFCHAALSLHKMLDHVAGHLQCGDPMPDADDRGDFEACGFCGQINGDCKTELTSKTKKSTCKFASRLHYNTALKNCRNVLCKAAPFTLTIRTHFEKSHPKTTIADYDIFGWVVRARVRASASKHRRSRTKLCAPRVTVVENVDPKSTSMTDATSSDVGGDMFRGQRRANATDSDWQARSEDVEEESGEGETTQEDNTSSGDSSHSKSQTNTTSSSSSSFASRSSGSLSSGPSFTEEAQAPRRCKRLTKTHGTTNATRRTVIRSSAAWEVEEPVNTQCRG